MKTIKKTLALYESEYGGSPICGNFEYIEEFRLTEFVEVEFKLLEGKEPQELHDPSRTVGT